jgi:hypothetical protein
MLPSNTIAPNAATANPVLAEWWGRCTLSEWVRHSRDPSSVRVAWRYAAQLGEMPPDAKALKGFSGAGVVELVEDHRGDTYRVHHIDR